MSLIDRAKRRFQRARERRGWLDHLALTIQHYLDAQGPANAGNITYFGFLSFFPLLAIGFAAIGIVSRAYPDARDSLVSALKDMFPVIIGDADGQVSIDTFETAAGTAGFLGVVALLFLGINWLSAVRAGLEHVFDLVPQETPNFFVGKLRDLLSLGAVGTVLIASVAISTTVTNFSAQVREGLGLDLVPGTGLLVAGLGIALGVAASTLLFLVLFRLLANADLPIRALVHGALFSAIGFEALKLVASRLLALSTRSPAAAVFGTALVLIVWISYFARVTLLGASWAETSPITVAARAEAAQEEALAEAEKMLQIEWGPSATEDEETLDRPEEVVTIIRSAATFAAITLLLRRALRQ
jgi:membrane protein